MLPTTSRRKSKDLNENGLIGGQLVISKLPQVDIVADHPSGYVN
jgi:hypothetical protein